MASELVSGSVSFQQMPSSFTRTPGLGGVGLGMGGGGYSGGNRTYLENDKESHHQHAFHWLPCRRQGEKVIAWQGQLFVIKESH